MIVENNQKEALIEEAKIEERNYNWEKAAYLYEQAAKNFLERNLLQEAAKIYDKLGFVYIRAVYASEIKQDYLNWNEQSVKAFCKAESLFDQTNDKLLSMECKAKALAQTGYVITSIEEARKNVKKSIDIFFQICEEYSKANDTKNFIRLSKLIAEPMILFLFICSNPSVLENYSQLGRKLIEKAWRLLKEVDTIETRIMLLLGEHVIMFHINRWTELTYGDKKQEQINKRHLKRCEETLNLTKNSDDEIDFFILGDIYSITGFMYCEFGSLIAEEKKERVGFAEKGFELLEKSIIFYKNSRNIQRVMHMTYTIDYLAGIFGRFEYLQKRILNDVQEVQKIGKIFDNLYTGIYSFMDFIPLDYYNLFASRSFLRADTRKSYAKLGIEYANKVLKRLAFGPYIVHIYQYLTHFYSQLVILTIEDNSKEEYIQKMLNYADKTENLSKEYKGGTVRSAGYTSLYRAYRTLANITKDKEEKIKNLELAIEGAKNNIKYLIESYRVFLAIQIRLALLYEELGVLTTDEKPLLQARELFLRIANESTERGYYYYTAACYEYIARLEDRLGNHMVSAEYYQKAKKAHEDSLSSIEYKPLRERTNEKIKYTQAWNFIENAKMYHKRENHIKAKKNYEDAAEILKILPSFNYEAAYYGAWITLEEAEHLSKQEKYEEAIKTYEKTRYLFDNAIYTIRFIRKSVRSSKELKKLEKVAKVRMNHCSARINLDEARILGKKGEHLAAAEKFDNAATQFRDICILYKIKRERAEIEAIYHLCRAWESMELAENYEDPEKFAEAANLFEKASDYFTESKLKFLAQGNSDFCLALEVGCKFDESHDMEVKTTLYPNVKSILRKAADLYDKGGFKNGADWALATSTYFDAAWYLIQADNVLDVNKKQEFLNYGSNYLKSSAELFHEAGYIDKEKEVLERLNRVMKEEKILVSALNTINKPSVSRSIEGIITPSCPIETSQSPRIGEIQQYSEEVSTFLEKDSKTKKYEIEYRDLLKDYPKSPRNQCRVGIVQIGISSSGDIMNEFYEEKPKGLLTLKEEKVNEVESKVKEMIENAHEEGINILLLPEMTVDLKYQQFLEQISNLAKKYQMYIIPGSYHNIETKSNISLIIGPEGILWQQEKHIPAIISLERGRFKEGIDTSTLPHKTIVCNTEYGRIAIVTCRDFLDMDLRVELKNFEPPVDIILNPALTPVTADFKAVHFDARRSIYAYTFFANVADYGNSLIYTPEKERVERIIPPKEEGLIFKDVDLFRLRSERKKWEQKQKEEKGFIQSTR
ncbi:MAG: nitrilase-related carbon-nitrogen hydrolase [Candidatus Hermodarchaeota archaeon]